MDRMNPTVRSNWNRYESFYGRTKEAAAQGILHCHDWYELYFHYGGGSFYSVNGNIYPLSSGQLMLLPPLCIHGPIFYDKSDQYERGYLYLTDETLKDLGCGQVDFGKIFERHTRHGRYQFLMPEEDSQLCKRLLQEMQHSGESVPALAAAEDHARMLLILCSVCRLIENPDHDVHPLAATPFIHEILEYVNTHFTQAISLEELADQFHWSSSHLSHEFVRYTGRSLYDYILFRRILLARELLHSDLPLNTIAFQCGFNDYSNFLRQFKKKELLTPNAYRKKFCTPNARGPAKNSPEDAP